MTEPLTEQMLNEDIYALSLAAEKACALIDRLRAEKAELLAALKSCECRGCDRYYLDQPSAHYCSFCAKVRSVIAKCEATS